jgi:hypothetical protein
MFMYDDWLIKETATTGREGPVSARLLSEWTQEPTQAPTVYTKAVYAHSTNGIQIVTKSVYSHVAFENIYTV